MFILSEFSHDDAKILLVQKSGLLKKERKICLPIFDYFSLALLVAKFIEQVSCQENFSFQ